MNEPADGPTMPPAGGRTGRVALVGMFLISASTLMLEVLLTKLFGMKLEHHFTFAIISLALFGFGAAGVFVHLWPRAFAQGPDLKTLGRYSFWYSCACIASVPLFAVTKLDPLQSGWQGALSLPAFFLLFAVPFCLAGICIAYTLTATTERPAVVYFWDLLGAGLGALATPWVIEGLGGYGTAVLAGALGFAAHLFYQHGAAKAPLWPTLAVRAPILALVAAATLAYPGRAQKAYGLDIVSTKYRQLRLTFLNDFGGAQQTYWNAIARIDVSHTATSVDPAFRGGLAERLNGQPIYGRFILVDGGASTRQYVITNDPVHHDFLVSALWAAPYVALSDGKVLDRALVIGVGGGIDVLIAKAFGTRHVDGIELNPDTYRLLLGRAEDPDRERYLPALASDAKTTVALFNAEARHFCHSLPPGPTYDVIQASTVDTLTAIQSAGNALSENFLYTEEAVGDYYRLLRPGGIVSLTHWFTAPPTLPLKMFVTYLRFLEKQGVERPQDHIVVVANDTWTDAMLKNGPFTREEVARIEWWAAFNGYRVVFHPFISPFAPPVLPKTALSVLPTGADAENYQEAAKVFAPFLNPEPEVAKPEDYAFIRLGLGDGAERQKVLANLGWDVSPATDERPYFYWVRQRSTGLFGVFDAAWVWPQPAIRYMFVAGLLGGLALVVLPLLRAGRKAAVHMRSVPFFALCGLGFILAENALFLRLTLFVGGPLYSLALVLPTVLIGYAIGSLLSPRLAPPKSAARLRLLAAYAAGFALIALITSFGLKHVIGLPSIVRLALAALLVVPFGGVLGLAVPWYMDALKERTPAGGAPLAWMWAVNSAFNVIGSMLFVPICRALSVTGTLVFAACCYFGALFLARSPSSDLALPSASGSASRST